MLEVVKCDPCTEAAAKALALSDLTPKGKIEFDWDNDFSESERMAFRVKASRVVEAISIAGMDRPTQEAEIVVTEEMMEAGLSVLAYYCLGEPPRMFLAALFNEMEAARKKRYRSTCR